MNTDDLAYASNGSTDPADTDDTTQMSSTDDSQDDSSEDSNDSTDSTRFISPAAQELIDKFDNMSGDKQREWLRTAESNTARTAQREAAKHIRSIYDIEPIVAPVQTTKSKSDIDEKIQKLEALESRINTKFEAISKKEENLEKEGAIKSYIQKFKISADPQDVLGDREFLKAMAETRNSDLSVDKRVKLAMAEVYGADYSFLERQTKSRQGGMATGNSRSKADKITYEDLNNPMKEIDPLIFER